MSKTIHLPRVVAAVLLGGALLGAAASSAFAQTTTSTPAPATTIGSVTASTVGGAPSTSDSDPIGYYLWRDDGGYHFKTHGPGAEHYFVARLYTTGTFKDIDRSMLEKDDHLDVLDNGHELVLRFHTYNGWDGINFGIDGGEYLRFNLRLDGQDISTDNIFLGPNGAHPPTNPFRIEI